MALSVLQPVEPVPHTSVEQGGEFQKQRSIYTIRLRGTPFLAVHVVTNGVQQCSAVSRALHIRHCGKSRD